ncbi:MAG TPA: hypothetical protein VET88_14680 [Gammaproteobacteria bacterium]|nr:hypothetical protein [Gammaproteobacteria bacterium]
MTMNLISFFRYFEGHWKITNLDSGTVGSLNTASGAGGVCHILEIGIGDVQRSELWGYDPADGCWKATGFSKDGERFTQVMKDLPDHESPQTGDRWICLHAGWLPSGAKTSARMKFLIESPDAYQVTFTDVRSGDDVINDFQQRIERQR